MCLYTVYATEQKTACMLAVKRHQLSYSYVGWLFVHVCVCVLDCPWFHFYIITLKKGLFQLVLIVR